MEESLKSDSRLEAESNDFVSMLGNGNEMADRMNHE